MGKTSIFSSDYNKHRRKRKRRTIVAIIILVILALAFLYSKSLKTFVNNELNYLKNSKLGAITNKGNKNDTASNSVNAVPKPSPENIEEKSVDVVLSNGLKVQAIYENKDGKNKFKYITPVDAAVSFSVNPSGTAIVILENSTQDMFYVTIDGSVKKVNDTKYVSTSGGVLPKDSILNSKPGYIWCSSPKFIDDNYVAYISQVPWFDGRTTKYIWVFNINDNNIKDRNDHRLYEQLGGDNVKFGNLTAKGLEVIIDNNSKFIKYNGQVIEISN